MESIISVLPDSIANQIAAGEVVQRPASVVKELLENAIDAGATEIKLTIKDAGKTLIQVSDNGSGMTMADARMCFERHATSKVKTAEDIFSIVTKGFRGEALASIASVAHVQLKTKQEDTPLGIDLVIEGSEVKKQEPVSCKKGSVFSVKNLFFNTPARRKFLKSDTVEFKHITEEFARVALMHNEIDFKLEHNSKILYHLPTTNHRKRVVDYFGTKYNEQLVPIEEATEIVNIKGFVCKPKAAKKTRGEQYLFVNRRFIKSHYLQHAITKAYEGLLPYGTYPSYFVYLELSPESIDINIHPTKTEIKFKDEKVLYAYLISTVKRALGIFNIQDTLDFNQPTDVLDVHSAQRDVSAPPLSMNQNYNPFKKSSGSSMSAGMGNLHPNKNPQNWESILEIQKEFDIDVEQEREPSFEEIISEGKAESTDVSNKTESTFFPEQKQPFIQILNQYIGSSIKSGFILIDQQLAHQRILFESFLKQFAGKNHSSQQQLFPESFTFSAPDCELLLSEKESFENMGLQLEHFGGNSIVVQGIPAGIECTNLQAYLEEVLEGIKQFAGLADFKPFEKLALSLAKASSIKVGKKLDSIEMEEVFTSLFSCENPNFCPQGKSVIVTFTEPEILKKFNV